MEFVKTIAHKVIDSFGYEWLFAATGLGVLLLVLILLILRGQKGGLKFLVALTVGFFFFLLVAILGYAANEKIDTLKTELLVQRQLVTQAEIKLQQAQRELTALKRRPATRAAATPPRTEVAPNGQGGYQIKPAQ